MGSWAGRNNAKITNRPTCGGNKKQGLAPTVGMGVFSLNGHSAKKRLAQITPMALGKTCAMLPKTMRPVCSGNVGNTALARHCGGNRGA